MSNFRDCLLLPQAQAENLIEPHGDENGDSEP